MFPCAESLLQFSSVQFSCSVVSNSLQPHGLQHASLPCPSSTPRTCSNSSPLSRWCHSTISSSSHPTVSTMSSPSPPAFNLSQQETPSKETPSFHWVSLSNSMKLWDMPCRATQDGWDCGGELWQDMVHCRREWVIAKSAAECPAQSSPHYKKVSSCVEVEKTSFRAFFKVSNVAFCCDSVKNTF